MYCDGLLFRRDADDLRHAEGHFQDIFDAIPVFCADQQCIFGIHADDRIHRLAAELLPRCGLPPQSPARSIVNVVRWDENPKWE